MMPLIALTLVLACRFIGPSDESVTLTGTPTVLRTDSEARFVRRLTDLAGAGLTADTPGAQIRFKTDSSKIVIRFKRIPDHKREDARTSITVIRVNGEIVNRFNPPHPHPAQWHIEEMLPDAPTESRVEVLLPYGDSVAYTGLEVDQSAYVAPWPLPETPLWIAYGDSITQGYHASDITATYPFRVAESCGLRVYNLGVGSRQTTAQDGAVLAGIPADLFTVLMGFNDFYHQKPPEKYAADLATIVDAIRQAQPFARVCIITPLWSSEPIPKDPKYRLAEYRAAAEQVARERSSQVHWIDGCELIPADQRYFTDGIHPNDEGFRILGARLARRLHAILKS